MGTQLNTETNLKAMLCAGEGGTRPNASRQACLWLGVAAHIIIAEIFYLQLLAMDIRTLKWQSWSKATGGSSH